MKEKARENENMFAYGDENKFKFLFLVLYFAHPTTQTALQIYKFSINCQGNKLSWI